MWVPVASCEDRPESSDTHPRHPAVSVLVATTSDSDRLAACLDSLAAQTLRADQFEVVVVHQEGDGLTRGIAEEFARRHPGHLLRRVQLREMDVPTARAVGVAAARGAFVTHLDHHDRLEPSFLEHAVAVAGADIIVSAPVTPLAMEDDGHCEAPEAEGSRPHPPTTRALPAHELPEIFDDSLAKLLPVGLARSASYEGVGPGEELLYWARLLEDAPQVQVRVVTAPSASYLRRCALAPEARQADFELAVTRRLRSQRSLESLVPVGAEPGPAVSALMHCQAQRVNDHLRRFPEQRPAVVEQAGALGLRYVPWSTVNAGLARQLGILFCFPPDLDTSGMVAARRLREQGAVTDVISADLSSIRSRDARALQVAGPSLGRQHVVQTGTTYYDWESGRDFAEQAWEQFVRWEAGPDAPGYDRLYSRAMAVSSHLAAALIKLRRPGLGWTAEFSDPLRYDTRGRPRPGDIGDDAVSREVFAALESAGHLAPRGGTFVDLAERLAYALADDIVFTNEQQRELMLGYCDDDPGLVERARARSQVWPHPIPAPELYEMGSSSQVELEPGVVHLAYFGVFYMARDLAVLLEAMAELAPREKDRIALHVFTPDPHRLMVRATRAGVADLVRARPYVDYLDYLALTRAVDVLVVDDAITADNHAINPYVPSKVADYRGSGSDIWALYEPGSVLSRMPVTYRSPVGDLDAAVAVLHELVGAQRVQSP